MILKNEPLSMSESKGYIKNSEVENTPVLGFVDKFTKLKAKDAIEMHQRIKSIGLIQIGESHIVKIIDLLPDSPEELSKILLHISINEDDAKKILDIVSEFK